jgi:hypothetical protein
MLNAKFGRKILISLAIILVIAAVVFVAFLSVPFTVITPDFRVSRALDIYPGAELIGRDEKEIDYPAINKNLVYWTQAPYEEVLAYYKQKLPGFEPSLDFELSSSLWSKVYVVTGVGDLEYVASYFYHDICCYSGEEHSNYTVLRLALVDLNLDDLPDLLKTSKSVIPSIELTQFTESLTKSGTLIIYAYRTPVSR